MCLYKAAGREQGNQWSGGQNRLVCCSPIQSHESWYTLSLMKTNMDKRYSQTAKCRDGGRTDSLVITSRWLKSPPWASVQWFTGVEENLNEFPIKLYRKLMNRRFHFASPSWNANPVLVMSKVTGGNRLRTPQRFWVVYKALIDVRQKPRQPTIRIAQRMRKDERMVWTWSRISKAEIRKCLKKKNKQNKIKCWRKINCAFKSYRNSASRENAIRHTRHKIIQINKLK